MSRRLLTARYRAIGGASVFALLALALAGCTKGTPAKSAKTVPTSPVTSPATATTFAPSSTVFEWARDGSPLLSIGGGSTATISAALPPDGSGSWLVAGTRVGVDGLPTATIWTSADGSDWQSQSLPNAIVGGEAEGAAEWHDVRIVVGSVGLGTDQRAEVWISTRPGASFAVATVPSTTASSSMTAVAVGPLGMFAIGTSGDQIGVWSSTDGHYWRESLGAEQVFASSPGARVNALLAQGNSVYAAGSVADGASTDAAVWASADGLTWRRVVTAPTAFAGGSAGSPGGRVIDSLAPLGAEGLVAVGGVERAGSWSDASWISPDGASWSRLSESFESAPPGSTARAVAALTNANGTTELMATGGTNTSQRVWKSVNGLTWSALTLSPGAAGSTQWRATIVASSPEATLVADGDPGQPHVLVDRPAGWVEPSTNPAVFGPIQARAVPEQLVPDGDGLAVVVGVDAAAQVLGARSSTTTEILTTADGSDWSTGGPSNLDKRASPPPGAAAETRLGSRWLAVGQVDRYADFWTSVDGTQWSEAKALPGSTPLEPTRINGLCAQALPSGPTVVAVGEKTSSTGEVAAVAWSSRDGLHWKPSTVGTNPAATTEDMLGCLSTATGFAAFGATTASNGLPLAAIWRSATGSLWDVQPTVPADPASPAALSTVAQAGGYWMAIAAPASDGENATGENATGEDATGENPTGAGMAWLSVDEGTTWDRVDTSSAPWTGYGTPVIDLGGFAGHTPVVVGTVDNRLAVWLGTQVDGFAGSGSG